MKKMMLIIILIISSNVYGTVWFDDGQEHDVDYEIDVVGHQVYILNDSFWDDPTTVNLIEDGILRSVYTMDDSRLNILGGTANGAMAWDNSHIYVQSGIVNGFLVTRQYASCTVDGGVFNSIGIQVIEHSTLEIYNGIFNFDENDKMQVSGTVTIHGYGFNVNDRPVSNGVYTGVEGILTGYLVGGDAVNIPFDVNNGAKLILVPEPCSLILISVGFLFLRKE